MSATEFPCVKNIRYKKFHHTLIFLHFIELYEYSIYLSSALLSIYILTNIYNILWVVLPWFGKLSTVMRKYKNSKRKAAVAAAKENGKPEEDSKILGDLYEIYYKNRDLKLFLELLAMGSGVAPSIAVMALFDKVGGMEADFIKHDKRIFIFFNFHQDFRNSLKAKIVDAKERAGKHGIKAEIKFEV